MSVNFVVYDLADFCCPKMRNKDNLSYFGEKNHEKITVTKLLGKKSPIRGFWNLFLLFNFSCPLKF